MSKTFNVLGKNIVFKDEEKLYIDIRNIFYKEALESSENFIDKFNKKYTSLDDFMIRGNSDGIKVIDNALEKGFDLLKNMGINNIDFNCFEKYSKNYLGNWKRSFLNIKEQYNTLMDRKYKRRNRRVRRVVKKGLVRANGNSYKTIEESIESKFLETIYEIGNIIGNVFENIGLNIRIHNKMSKIFKAAETKKKLKNGIYEDIFSIHYAIIDIINEKKGYAINPFYDKKGKEEAKDIYYKLIDGEIKKDKIKEKSQEMIYKYPFSKKFYRFVLGYFKNYDKEIEEYAKFFGVEIKSIKDKMLNQNLKKI
ncbi:MAG: hypothetical protein Q4B63_09395 [Clostridium perfringens]|nr:hypothetical protein [Clostridium perfringens]